MPCSGVYMDDYADYDSPGCDIWREKRLEIGKSRKAHACYECGRKIEKGERQDVAEALQEGLWFDMRRCVECLTLAELITTEHGACPQWGLLREISSELDYDWRAFHPVREEN